MSATSGSKYQRSRRPLLCHSFSEKYSIKVLAKFNSPDLSYLNDYLQVAVKNIICLFHLNAGLARLSKNHVHPVFCGCLFFTHVHLKMILSVKITKSTSTKFDLFFFV